VLESYHSSIAVQSPSRATEAKQEVVVPSVDALGSPAISSSCLMCGAGFTEKDLTELEWPVSDSPAHRDCYLEYVDERNRFSDLIEEMRGA
jgi:hypothetical protein